MNSIIDTQRDRYDFMIESLKMKELHDAVNEGKINSDYLSIMLQSSAITYPQFLELIKITNE